MFTKIPHSNRKIPLASLAASKHESPTEPCVQSRDSHSASLLIQFLLLDDVPRVLMSSSQPEIAMTMKTSMLKVKIALRFRFFSRFFIHSEMIFKDVKVFCFCFSSLFLCCRLSSHAQATSKTAKNLLNNKKWKAAESLRRIVTSGDERQRRQPNISVNDVECRGRIMEISPHLRRASRSDAVRGEREKMWAKGWPKEHRTHKMEQRGTLDSIMRK